MLHVEKLLPINFCVISDIMVHYTNALHCFLNNTMSKLKDFDFSDGAASQYNNLKICNFMSTQKQSHYYCRLAFFLLQTMVKVLVMAKETQ